MQTVDLFNYIFEKRLIRPFLLSIGDHDSNQLFRLKFNDIFKQDPDADTMMKLWLNNILKVNLFVNFEAQSKL